MPGPHGHTFAGPSFDGGGDATLALTTNTPVRGPDLHGSLCFVTQVTGSVTTSFQWFGSASASFDSPLKGQILPVQLTQYLPCQNPRDMVFCASGECTLTFNNAR